MIYRIFILIFGLIAVAFKVSASSNSNEFSMIPVEGRLRVSDIGRSLKSNMSIGDEIIEYSENEDFDKVDYNRRLSFIFLSFLCKSN